MFEFVDVVLVTKTDLMPYMDFELAEFRRLVQGLNPRAPVIPLSARTGEGMEAWLEWLKTAVKGK
jgi:hydrogenase nickel incorporation protein HypB